ncbi:hypothetical protein HDU87_003798 [Geranomyces variabilis]|uniref:Uncharacterized protein n=1 Tax=Geranomyces variabilis TaxID=109894 RepID=A0AAD5XQY9_9FUNG|nr:hypothetical protein HDU87_003798 [Geranomyces variabilis]
MPVKIIIDDTQLTVSLTTAQKFLSGRFYDVTIPLADIAAVHKYPTDGNTSWALTIKYGTHIPGKLRAGTFFYWSKKREWVYTSDAARSIQIELKENAPYGNLVLEVEDGKEPDEVIAEIARAIKQD